MKPLWMLYPKEVGEIAKNERIYNVITQQAMARTSFTNVYYMPFIKMAKEPDAFPKTAEAKVDLAKEILMTSTALQISDAGLLDLSLQYIDLTWPAYKMRMMNSPGFAEWMFAGGVVFSFYMYMFYAEVDGFLDYDPKLLEKVNPVRTFQMDAAFGQYHDVMGRPITYSAGDLVNWHIGNHGLWRGVRWRAPYFGYYLCEAGPGATILDLCSGAFNMEKRFGYVEKNLGQRVIGYDLDKNVVNVLPHWFSKPIAEYGFEFRNESFFESFKDTGLCHKVDYVALQGGFTYFRPQREQIFYGVRDQLKDPVQGEPPKRFVLETEIATSDMAQALYVLGLENQSASMVPYTSIEESNEEIADVVKRVGGFKIAKVTSDAGFYGDDVAVTTALYVLETTT